MPRVLVAGMIHPRGIDLLRSVVGVDVDYVEAISLDSYLPFIERADALLVRTQPVPAEAIARAGRLRIVARHGVGYDSVDVAALNRRGIPLAVVGDVNSRAVAEHTMLLLLTTAKRLLRYEAAVRNGDWDYRNSLEATELHGKRLLIIGFGKIGRHVAGMAAAFGLRCLAFDPFQSADAIRACGVEPVPDLIDGLSQADFVTVHTPKTPGSSALLGSAELSRLKPSAIVINAARGGLIDEAALTQALQEGRLAGAGLDVFEREPPAPGNPLLTDPRVVLTPHSAPLTLECAERMAVASAQNVLDFFAGTLDLALVVNRAELTSQAAGGS